MLANVKQATIAHEVKSTITPGSLIFTDEYKISARLIAWDISTIVCVMLKASMPALEDGDGFCEVHVNTLGRFLVPTSFLATTTSRISPKPLYLGFF